MELVVMFFSKLANGAESLPFTPMALFATAIIGLGFWVLVRHRLAKTSRDEPSL